MQHNHVTDDKKDYHKDEEDPFGNCLSMQLERRRELCQKLPYDQDVLWDILFLEDIIIGTMRTDDLQVQALALDNFNKKREKLYDMFFLWGFTRSFMNAFTESFEELVRTL